MTESKYGKHIITELKSPDLGSDFAAWYAHFASRILYIDEKVMPGTFQMNCSWYMRPMAKHWGEGHRHDVPDILGFIGSDYKKPYELGGEIEFWLEDEKFILNKTCMIFIPAGMKHTPMIVRRVDRPILHFSTVASGKYTQLK